MGAYWKCNKKKKKGKHVGFTALPAPLANGSIKIIDFLFPPSNELPQLAMRTPGEGAAVEEEEPNAGGPSRGGEKYQIWSD